MTNPSDQPSAPLPHDPDGPWFAVAPTTGPGDEDREPPAESRDVPPDADPWAHRRGEPRLFAFFWSLYILLAVSGALLWLARIPAVSASAYSPAARTLLVVLAAGITVLWPMTRLSQSSVVAPVPRVGACLADFVVVLAPVQMVVWALWVLADWPVDIVAGAAALLGAWAMLTGAILALALVSSNSLAGRSIWMAVCLGVVGAAPLAVAILPQSYTTGSSWMLAASPFTGIYTITGAGWAGPLRPIQPGAWGAVLVTASVAVVGWAAAFAVAGAGTPRRSGLH